MARQRINVNYDHRANLMSAAALRCRADSHAWVRVIDPPAVVVKMVKETGVVEKRFVCNICTAEKVIVLNPRTGERVKHPTIKYHDETYLIKDHSGRMSRLDAELADLARTYASLY